jgi:hypothetical protein
VAFEQIGDLTVHGGGGLEHSFAEVRSPAVSQFNGLVLAG